MASWCDPDAPTPLFFGPPDCPLFGVIHAHAGPVSDLGVVVATSIVNEAVTAHRALRLLAGRLAAAGLPALVYDPPSTGDSSGADDVDGRVGRWRASLGWAADELRARTGIRRVAVVGVRLGATIATAAVDAGLDVAALVLWDPLPTGEAWLREERSYHLLARQVPPGPDDPRLPDGVEELAGFVLPAGTVADLLDLDLRPAGAAGWPAGLPVLLSAGGSLRRRGLVEALERRGAEVEERPLPGLAEMLEEAERAAPPHHAIELILEWLSAIADRPDRSLERPARRDGSELLVDGVRERPFLVDGEGGRLFGITAEGAAAAPGVSWAVFFNAGFVRHIGPNRMYVRWARAWAQAGLPSLRVDGRSVGESDGYDGPHDSVTALYTEGAIADAMQLVSALRERHEAGELVLVGLCSGAFMAFHVALRLDDVRSIILLNPQILSYDVEESERGRALYVRRSMLSPAKWRSMLARASARRQLQERALLLVRTGLAGVRRRLSSRSTAEDEWLVDALGRLHAKGTSVHFLMSEGDPGLTYLRRHLGPDLERAPAGALQLNVVPSADHTFRPLPAQARLWALVHEAAGAGRSS